MSRPIHTRPRHIAGRATQCEDNNPMSKEFLSPSFGPSRSTSPKPINTKEMANSIDIKRQLSQSLGGSNSVTHGGISKPSSRRGSLVPIKLNESDKRDDDDDEDGGNERKRRDNINDKIQELLMLVPEEWFKENITGKETEEELAMKNSGTKDGKPNKGQILTKSVEYIQYLQNLIDENNRKEVELLLKLKNLGLGNKDSIGHTSAEVALGKIGVGPLSDEYFRNVLVESANTNKAHR